MADVSENELSDPEPTGGDEEDQPEPQINQNAN